MNGGAQDVVAIIPVKALPQAKSRLSPHLDRGHRENLVLNMLRLVIRTAAEAGTSIWIVGDDPTLEDLAKGEGARWQWEEGVDVNHSLNIAFRQAWNLGKSPLYLPGDLPFLQSQDLIDLMASAPHRKNGVLAPARSGGGTNAVLLPRPSAFRIALGPGSFHKHVAQAASLGLPLAIHFSPGLALDLDTWDDLKAYQALEPGLLERLSRGEPSHA
jgi:2-phospho-L-lactate guanylyltransferase